MAHVVVLLRGVNVGGRQRVPMATFREVLEALGLSEVRTLLNSGNAVGRVRTGAWDRLAHSVRAALAETVKVDVPVIVVPAETLHAIVTHNALERSTVDPSRLLVSFAQDASALSSLAAIHPLLGPDEQFVIGAHAAYLHCAGGVRESKAATAVMGRVGHAVTTRNWATVQKLRALLVAAGS